MSTQNPYEPNGQVAENEDQLPAVPPRSFAFNAAEIFNLVCKMLGLYWLSYGVLTSTETVYMLFTSMMTNIPMQYQTDQSVSLLWGFEMLTLGAVLMLLSRRITAFAFMLDGHP